MTIKPRDIGAVDEVLGWDPRGDDEEYELLEKAQEAFSRIKCELRNLRKSRKEWVQKYDELVRMNEGYIKSLHETQQRVVELEIRLAATKNIGEPHEPVGRTAYVVNLETMTSTLQAENERLQRLLDHATQANPGTSVLVMLMNESSAARAEVEMLRGIGCSEAKLDEPESGPCGVCLKCAEERGARWALERHGNPFATKTLAQYAEEICRDARGKQ